jgi:sialic acid synthase SpsE/D-lyxose ketol-isomerase
MNFNNLFILDIANNHQGSVKHGINIIDALADSLSLTEGDVAIKFQMRHLETFITPAARLSRSDSMVKRFLSTELKFEDFQVLKDHACSRGFKTICTPFDEKSVDDCVSLNFDALKIASCSATDWPLITKVVETGKPIICSTGGLDFKEIDKLVSHFKHNGSRFAIMHCVSVYPSQDYHANLWIIDHLRRRYQDVQIGWSTHEDPSDTSHVQIATAFGASIFEKHVGVTTEDWCLNDYSANPRQIVEWILSQTKARRLIGISGNTKPIFTEEKNALNGLMRGVFAGRAIAKNEILNKSNFRFAIPKEAEQLTPGQLQNLSTIVNPKELGEAIYSRDLFDSRSSAERNLASLKNYIHEIKALLNLANIVLPPNFTLEISHHSGIENFSTVGATLLNILNRDYAKKYIVLLPGQAHPTHYHMKKEESFILLWGDLHITLNDRKISLELGNPITIAPGVWHDFSSAEGCVFEEISTANYEGDSIYADRKINAMNRGERKTTLDEWGRFKLLEKFRTDTKQ